MTSEIVASSIIICCVFLYQWRVKSDFIFPLIAIPLSISNISYNWFIEKYSTKVDLTALGFSCLLGLCIFGLLFIYYRIDYIQHKEIYDRNKNLMKPKGQGK